MIKSETYFKIALGLFAFAAALRVLAAVLKMLGYE